MAWLHFLSLTCQVPREGVSSNSHIEPRSYTGAWSPPHTAIVEASSFDSDFEMCNQLC